ncbi:Penicillin-binding protein 1C [Frankliniella fusca]|uniref:Penicillin-binding protein 1C n=1 Tax=Frankliniella fusca TaxID=407009 RepID=A0AAE1H903_9NEOP|nr:Penicillin-binding protein 1C [Frankliniella fusca]KAK3917052.1 Penicillin-binding protein 1C [Frankliniella fusca]KAK3917063.1 Penicillin-binding protein 1C [Frankliniella fusca]KAK3924332.1 Penicillin-binding protein 1C [Frankliniella fusca]KAK3926924.1 Penicillin-binding protein 1C [Frankliniella fusca]
MANGEMDFLVREGHAVLFWNVFNSIHGTVCRAIIWPHSPPSCFQEDKSRMDSQDGVNTISTLFYFKLWCPLNPMQTPFFSGMHVMQSLLHPMDLLFAVKNRIYNAHPEPIFSGMHVMQSLLHPIDLLFAVKNRSME